MKDDYAKKRRDGLRTDKCCINGKSHGPATHGVLCWPCRAVHRGMFKTRAEVPRQPPDGDDGNAGQSVPEVVHVE